MASRPPNPNDLSRDTVLPSFREAFPDSMFGQRQPLPSVPAFPGQQARPPPGAARAPAPPPHPAARDATHHRTPSVPVPMPARTQTPAQRAPYGATPYGGQFMILESNPSGRLDVAANSSLSMQHAEWVHSGTQPSTMAIAEQRKLRCTFPGCTRTFLTRPNLDRHLRMAHGPPNPPTQGHGSHTQGR